MVFCIFVVVVLIPLAGIVWAVLDNPARRAVEQASREERERERLAAWNEYYRRQGLAAQAKPSEPVRTRKKAGSRAQGTG